MNPKQLSSKLMAAVYKKDYATLRKLLNKDVINLTDEAGDTLLNSAVAASDADPKMAKFLVDQGAAVDVPAQEGWTALHFAAHVLLKDIIQVLVDAGADVNARDSSGCTPLHHVVMAADPRVMIAMSLLEQGADPNHKDNRGRSPKELAKETAQVDLFNLLRDAQYQKSKKQPKGKPSQHRRS